MNNQLCTLILEQKKTGQKQTSLPCFIYREDGVGGALNALRRFGPITVVHYHLWPQALTLCMFVSPSQFYKCFLTLFHCDHWSGQNGNTSMPSKTTVIHLNRRVCTAQISTDAPREGGSTPALKFTTAPEVMTWPDSHPEAGTVPQKWDWGFQSGFHVLSCVCTEVDFCLMGLYVVTKIYKEVHIIFTWWTYWCAHWNTTCVGGSPHGKPLVCCCKPLRFGMVRGLSHNRNWWSNLKALPSHWDVLPALTCLGFIDSRLSWVSWDQRTQVRLLTHQSVFSGQPELRYHTLLQAG